MAEPVGPPDGKAPDHIWSFRGYRLSPGEFNNAMIHFYRGEISRSNIWRTRLDTTTNWAVVATGAALTFAFNDPTHSHIMIPINTLLITLFLGIEARRYRYYELWSYRVRMMETDFFAAMLAPPFHPGEMWATRLVDNLLHPSFTITFWEAFGRRFRRNYSFIYILLVIAWVLKLIIHPDAVTTFEQFIDRAAVGGIPGSIVIAAGMLFNLSIFAIGFLTISLQESKGEVLHGDGAASALDILHSASDAISGRTLWTGKREQLAHIITGKGDEISERILNTFSRGVTSVKGTGMYSGEERAVLLVAIHPEQSRALKEMVREIDPRAFVIIHHAEEVIGAGFRAPS
jgi:uncharacterized membrane protein